MATPHFPSARDNTAMTSSQPAFLDHDDIMRLARQTAAAAPCEACAAVAQPGWEAVPGGFDASVLERVGTLRPPGVDEPTVEEFHPRGTHAWSPDAPIALAWFPYNRCDVWQCTRCARAYLRYTEYGGYYQEERIRPLDGNLVERK
jgi:hypothetical protein